MTQHTKRKWSGIAFATIGSAILLGEIFRNWFFGHEIEGTIVLIGALFGFVGFFITDSTRALTGGKFVVDSATQVISVVRNGRRKTDQHAVVIAPTDDVKDG